MQPSPVPGCLQALIEQWRFPKPAGGDVEISFPFVFRADNGAVELQQRSGAKSAAERLWCIEGDDTRT